MSDRPLKEILKEEKDAVEKVLRKELEGLREKIYPKLYEAMEYALFTGGKRVRPIIIKWFAHTGKPDEEKLSRAMAALEFIHTYSLIHDDLPAMDDDDTRRGKPTVHIKFGEGMAILAGDALLTEAFGLLARTGISRLSLILSAAAGAAGMVGGQAADIAAGQDKDINYINNLKTAKLFEASAMMGATLAGFTENDLEKAAAYGINLGRAFQLRDDLLDDESENIDKTRREASEFVDRAKKTIMDINGTQNLIRIADYVIERNK